jgi:hypothetical protein
MRSRRHSSPGDSRRGSGAELEEQVYAEDANMVSAAPRPRYCVHSLKQHLRLPNYLIYDDDDEDDDTC